MKFREKVALEHPNDLYEYALGGVNLCPHSYGYERDMGLCKANGELLQPNNELCTRCWDREIPGTETTETTGVDMVNQPPHYTNGIECIDEMIGVFGIRAVANFCLCNVWKYRKRAIHKNGEEDMKKSDWYMNKYMELIEFMDKPTGSVRLP